jgi:hypothetical protein
MIQHDGKRLESLSREELLSILDLRVADVKVTLRGSHDCPPNRHESLCGVVEVLNAIAVVDPEGSPARLWSGKFINFVASEI